MPSGMGRGRGMGGGQGNPQGRGPGGSTICRCPGCGHTQPHTRGVPCSQLACPKCGMPMRGERC